MNSIHDLLEIALKRNASDLILKAGSPPVLRVDGRMEVPDAPPLTMRDTRNLAFSIVESATRDRMLEDPDAEVDLLSESDEAAKCMTELQEKKELDVVFTIPRLVRVRANLFRQRGNIGASLRIIPLRPYTIDELRLPAVLKEVAMQPQGLVIITGPTGSGKTTTMAAIIEEINRNRPSNIFTIEEPIEYVYADRKSVIHQREVGTDTQSFASALRSVMRQTPDVICIGEMRDAETMDVAMTAAEIGHLVVTTLHTVSAPATLDRIINSFPQHQRGQVQSQLAASLLCVTSQRLVHRANGPGRLPAVEVLRVSPTVRKQIEESERDELYASMRDGQHFGMNTMNQALEKLYQAKQITYDEAMQFAGNPAELRQLLRRS
jgi:twitching motility protein PilT